ncbi:hypothetical protein ACFORL_10030, partial [Legionella dresdenensis]
HILCNILLFHFHPDGLLKNSGIKVCHARAGGHPSFMLAPYLASGMDPRLRGDDTFSYLGSMTDFFCMH